MEQFFHTVFKLIIALNIDLSQLKKQLSRGKIRAEFILFYYE